MGTDIGRLAKQIITEHARRKKEAEAAIGGETAPVNLKRLLSEQEWEIMADMLKALILPLPHLPTVRIFTWAMGLAVPFGIEVVLVRDGKVFLSKRDFCGDVAYHTPGTYVAKDESFLQTAQRCADKEMKIRVASARPISPPVNHPFHPRFHDVTVLFLCEFEGEPQGGEWFGAADFPQLLQVQQEYGQYIRPFLQ